MRFEFCSPTRIVFGPGTLREAAPLAQSLGRRVLVVGGANLRRAESLLSSLREAGMVPQIFQVSGEPKIQTVEAGVAAARTGGAEVVVSIGGGSVLDTGKAIAAMLANEGELLDYLELIGRGKTLSRPSVPHIAIPTTAGTGSEVTRNAVLADPAQRVKVSLRSPLMLPTVALVDPELTYELPPMLTASTGLDALTQLIEPYVCLRANPMTDALCKEGIQRAGRSFRRACAGADPAAREDMALAGLFGGLALANAGLGAVHGIAGPLGGMFPAPHGLVCAALLPHVMEMNLRALRRRQPASQALGRYAEVAHWLTGKPTASAEEGIQWVRTVVAEMCIPGLGSYGVTQEHTNALVEKALHASSMKPNPIVPEPEELAEVLQRAL
jgi:alcohol dehydrogenase class IV